ncbi:MULTISPECIES: DoxX family protein [Halomonas]|uniref:Membrane protein n=1 Tax=Halomonas halophila TaxID=29573 RepID=A0ABQ0U4E6_9GAMM|nr:MULTISPECIES: DoxX family protein [Halomonas]MDR5888957.1 DoxX family protein [Halomonas salina]RAH36348.1 DoxX family protein [Halomonas sp. SL1]WJY07479.1 DoxX family protein [Halomonas halophila]GEK73411.1 membrane protein [Halomonas halophila]
MTTHTAAQPNALDRLQPAAITLLRLSLGVMALAHGLLKVLVFTVPGTVGYFESLGLPGEFAYLTILAEIGGGAALLLGVYTRWVALAMIPTLLGATWVHSGNGWMFSNEGGGWEFPLFWAIALLAQAGLGGGRLVLSRRFA